MFVNYILSSFCSNMLKTLIAFILLNHVKGENLLLKVNNETTMRRQFCAGEELTFVCTIRTSGYLWTVGSLLSRNEGQIVVGNQSPVGRFTLSAQGSGDGRNSTLKVVAFSGLNGVLITCKDPGNSINSQTAMITLLDMCPTDISPDLNDDCSSVNVSLTVNNCTQQYIVSISGSNNMSEISYRYVPIMYSGKVRNIGRFDLSNLNSSLCSQYYVKVTAIFSDGSNMTCPTISVIQTTTSENFSTTTEQDSETRPTSIIIAVVVVILVIMMGLIVLVIMIVISVRKCKGKRKRSISNNHDNDKFVHYSHVNQEKVPMSTTKKKEDRNEHTHEIYHTHRDQSVDEDVIPSEKKYEDSKREGLTERMCEDSDEEDNKNNKDEVSSKSSSETEDEDKDSDTGYSPDDEREVNDRQREPFTLDYY